ncbi:MAG: hypothetical protein WDN23_02430 [Edaphobacter sp.]
MRKIGLFGMFVAVLIIGITAMNHIARNSTRNQDSTSSVPAMRNSPTSNNISRVPFIGCKSDGQSGPVGALHGKSKVVPIEAEEVQQLAYYASIKEFGVLAPRGWYCYGTYGSDGVNLYVSPRPINLDNLFSETRSGFAGPVVELSITNGGTSGRFEVAKTIARVFPSHRAFVTHVIEEGIEPASLFPLGPYPNDTLIYKSNEIVEYRTPANTEGLGTNSFIQSGEYPINGVVMLMGEDTDLVRLSVRLPPKQADLIPAIVQQLQSDVANQLKSNPQNTASMSKATSSSPEPTPPKVEMGYPVPEKDFVAAYVLANIGRDDLDEAELDQLGRDEYQLGKMMDTKSLLQTGSLFNTRGSRAMAYLDKLSRQQH